VSISATLSSTKANGCGGHLEFGLLSPQRSGPVSLAGRPSNAAAAGLCWPIIPACWSCPMSTTPNLISRFMKLMLGQLSADWQQRWGHPLALVETFVDPRFYTGTAYKVSGWSHLGKRPVGSATPMIFMRGTTPPNSFGCARWSRSLCEITRGGLAGGLGLGRTKPPRPLRGQSARDPLLAGQASTKRLPEFRRAQSPGLSGLGLICVAVMAMAQGVILGPDDLAIYADTLSQPQLRACAFEPIPTAETFAVPRKRPLPGSCMGSMLTSWSGCSGAGRTKSWDPGKIDHHFRWQEGARQCRSGDCQCGRFPGTLFGQCCGPSPRATKSPPPGATIGRPTDGGQDPDRDAMHTQDDTARKILLEGAAETISCPSRVTSPRWKQPGLTCSQTGFFPPPPTPKTRVLKREHNRGRLEIRFSGMRGGSA